MSQSDYLKRRVTSHILNRQKTEKDELKPVLSSDEYTSFKRYQITNTVINDEINYKNIVPQGKHIIFDIETDVSSCPEFKLCKDTNTRDNRINLTSSKIDPNPCPRAPLFIKNTENPLDPVNVAYVPQPKRNCKLENSTNKNSYLSRRLDCPQPVVIDNIDINLHSGQSIYKVDLKDYTTGIDLHKLTYNYKSFDSKIKVSTTTNEFTEPGNVDSWSILTTSYGWFGEYPIDLGNEYINFNNNKYNKVWVGNGRITLSKIGYDYTESFTDFNRNPMICPLWDIHGWTRPNTESNLRFGKANFKAETNELKIYLFIREYDNTDTNMKTIDPVTGEERIIKITQAKNLQTDSRQQLMVTIELNSPVQANIKFEYGIMTPGNDFPGINSDWSGSQDGIVGISYGNNNITSLNSSNIDYINEPTKLFQPSESIAQKFENQTSIGGTSNLAYKTINFSNDYSIPGVSISGSILTVDSIAIDKNEFQIYSHNNGLESNYAVVKLNPMILRKIEGYDYRLKDNNGNLGYTTNLLIVTTSNATYTPSWYAGGNATIVSWEEGLQIPSTETHIVRDSRFLNTDNTLKSKSEIEPFIKQYLTIMNSSVCVYDESFGTLFIRQSVEPSSYWIHDNSNSNQIIYYDESKITDLWGVNNHEDIQIPYRAVLKTYLGFKIPENNIQYPGIQNEIFRPIPISETNAEAIDNATNLLNTTIDGHLVVAFVLFISNSNDRRIYLKSDYNNIVRNQNVNATTNVYSFETIPNT